MRLVVDTNTIISGSLWHGPSARLITAALGGQARMFLSLAMLLELRETLQLPKFAARLAGRGETAESMTERFRAACHVLACAVTAVADAIVTGDKDLLALKEFEGIPILKVRDVLAMLGISAE